MKKSPFFFLCVIFGFLLTTAGHAQTTALDFQNYLNDGQATLASQLLSDYLTTKPADDSIRFQVAVAQVLAGTEGLAQTWYKYGLHSSFEEVVPFLRMPVPVNPAPKALTYEETRIALKQFQTNLDQAAYTLSAIKDSSTMKVPLDVQSIKLRIKFTAGNPDSDFIRFLDVFQRAARPGPITQGQSTTNLEIHFDVGDARWLEGYCHLLSAMIDTWLAYDSSDLFEHTAQLFFANPVTPYGFLLNTNQPGTPFNYGNIVDVITAVHLIHFKLEDPQRMQSARNQLLQVISLSRRSWQDILVETDNDHEWIPNPKQDGALARFKVTPEMIQTWTRFLDESESMLNGKTLAPFWRNAPGKGVNLSKVFTQPTDFDLILWLQGTAAAPYLEEGQITDKMFWSTLNQAFHGQFLFYGIWFN
jgi:hypothetical protein